MARKTKEGVPAWAAKLATEISVLTPDMERFDLRWTPPEESDSGVDHVEMAPSVLERKEAGPNDGMLETFVVTDFDLLGVPHCFDKLEDLNFILEPILNREQPLEFFTRPIIYIRGTKDRREVTFVIYFEPFDGVTPIQDKTLFPSGNDEEG